jgi:hypothetical protein
LIPVTFIPIYDNILAQNKNMCKADRLRRGGHRAHVRSGRDDVLLQLLEGIEKHEGTTGDGAHIAASGPQEAQRSLDESGVQVQVAVQARISTGIRAEQNDLLRVANSADAPRDLC